MKYIFFSCSLLLILASCSEAFKKVDPSPFNAKIRERTDILSPEALITLYYNWPGEEGTPHLSIESQKTGASGYKITLIHDNEEDDSEQALKIMMWATHSGNTWSVKEIRKNWKCGKDRGHSSWGIAPCE